MVLDYRIFINGGQKQFKNRLALLDKVNYPTTFEGLVKLGLEEENRELLKGFLADTGLKERETCSLFIHAYLKESGVERFKGRRALVDWMTRKGFAQEVREAMRKLVVRVVEAEKGGSGA